MSLLPRGRRVRRLLPLGALVALAASLAPVAFAADPVPDPIRVKCSGKTLPVKGDTAQVNYRFSCRGGDVKSFAVVAADSVIGFEANADVFVRNTTAPSTTDSAGCEGESPSRGFHCKGLVTHRNTVSGFYEPDAAPCSAKGRWQPKVAVVAVAADGTVSGPFGMGGPGKCKPARSTKRR